MSVALPSTALETAGASVTPTSMTFSRFDLGWDDYEKLGVFLGQMNRACAWWVGDFLLYGEEIYGEQYAQIEHSLGLAPQTLANRRSVAKHVPRSRRRATLSFATHAEVAYLDPKEQEEWLAEAERNQWTRSQLRDAMRFGNGRQEIEAGAERVSHRCPECGYTGAEHDFISSG